MVMKFSLTKAYLIGFNMGVWSTYRLNEFVKYAEKMEHEATKDIGVYWSLYSIGVDPNLRRKGCLAIPIGSILS